MTSRIRNITVDCRDPFELARFWRGALGYVDTPDDRNEPADPEAQIIDPRGLHPGLLFIGIPEPKSVKNRVHLDVVPEGTRDAEVERLLGLGATLVDDLRTADGAGWAVLADPEGNEFCVERSLAERGHPAPQKTGDRAFPRVGALPERDTYEQLLDWYRAGVVAKVKGISPLAARAVPGPSATSIAGLVKHLALVEDSWFTVRFAGEPDPAPWVGIDWEADPDWEFRTAIDDDLDHLLDLYRAACQRSCAVAARHQLDDVGADTARYEFTLRFLYAHLLEETARHLGHIDILIELLAGTTGE